MRRCGRIHIHCALLFLPVWVARRRPAGSVRLPSLYSAWVWRQAIFCAQRGARPFVAAACADTRHRVQTAQARIRRLLARALLARCGRSAQGPRARLPACCALTVRISFPSRAHTNVIYLLTEYRLCPIGNRVLCIFKRTPRCPGRQMCAPYKRRTAGLSLAVLVDISSDLEFPNQRRKPRGSTSRSRGLHRCVSKAASDSTWARRQDRALRTAR